MGLSMTTIITTIDYCMEECDDYEYKNYKNNKKETTKALRIKRDKVNRYKKNYKNKKKYGSDIRKNSVDEIINRHCRCAEFECECECLNSSPSGWGFLPIDIDD